MVWVYGDVSVISVSSYDEVGWAGPVARACVHYRIAMQFGGGRRTGEEALAEGGVDDADQNRLRGEPVLRACV